MAKGPAYERELCKRLSLWWTGGVDDFVFWRAAGSGGMATSRARRGKRARGHEGDIAAVDARGADLTRLVAVEIKRGYNGHTGPAAGDVLDKLPRHGQTAWEGFVEQAMAAAGRSGAPFWLLIHRRDGRGPVAYLPRPLFRLLVRVGCQFRGPRALFDADLRIGDGYEHHEVVGLSLDALLAGADPSDVRDVLRELSDA